MSSSLVPPTIFALNKTQNFGFEFFYFRAKNEAVRLRFMAQRAASYGAAVLHAPKVRFIKPPADEALFRFTSQYEASPLRCDMKHKRLKPLV